MKIYAPLYNNGERQIEELDSNDLALFIDIPGCRRFCRHNGNGLYGNTYRDKFYLTPEDVRKYWNKEPVRSYTMDEIKQIEKENRQ